MAGRAEPHPHLHHHPGGARAGFRDRGAQPPLRRPEGRLLQAHRPDAEQQLDARHHRHGPLHGWQRRAADPRHALRPGVDGTRQPQTGRGPDGPGRHPHRLYAERLQLVHGGPQQRLRQPGPPKHELRVADRPDARLRGAPHRPARVRPRPGPPARAPEPPRRHPLERGGRLRPLLAYPGLGPQHHLPQRHGHGQPRQHAVLRLRPQVHHALPRPLRAHQR